MNNHADKLLCGFGRVDITPEGSVWLAGFANRKSRSEGIHSRLYSHCLVVKYKQKTVCMISNDLLDLSVDSVGEISRQISSGTGLAQTNIFIHSIHTHSAPSMAEAVLKNPENKENIRYRGSVLDNIAANAVKVINDESSYRKCRLKAGTGFSALGVCRRTIDPKTGMAVMGKNNESGTGLPLNVIEFEDESGQPFATLFNYSCHPVSLNELSLAVSSDFAGAARDCIGRKLGSHAVFFNGAAGDINPKYPLGNDCRITEKAGEELCADVLKIKLETFELSDMKIASKIIALPFKNRKQTAEFIDFEVVRKSAETTDFASWKSDLQKWGGYMKKKLEEGSLPDFRKVKASVIKTGKLILFFSQGEIFSGYQGMLRDKFPEYMIAFFGYTDGKAGYLPDSDSFKNKGYEVEQAYIYTLEPSPLDEESCGIYLHEAESLIRQVV